MSDKFFTLTNGYISVRNNKIKNVPSFFIIKHEDTIIGYIVKLTAETLRSEREHGKNLWEVFVPIDLERDGFCIRAMGYTTDIDGVDIPKDTIDIKNIVVDGVKSLRLGYNKSTVYHIGITGTWQTNDPIFGLIENRVIKPIDISINEITSSEIPSLSIPDIMLKLREIIDNGFGEHGRFTNVERIIEASDKIMEAISEVTRNTVKLI